MTGRPEDKVILRGPRQVLGGFLLMVAIWFLSPKVWQEIVSKGGKHE